MLKSFSQKPSFGQNLHNLAILIPVSCATSVKHTLQKFIKASYSVLGKHVTVFSMKIQDVWLNAMHSAGWSFIKKLSLMQAVQGHTPDLETQKDTFQ